MAEVETLTAEPTTDETTVAAQATAGQALELVRPFSDIGRSDIALVGGKGANLGEMTRTGLPVPPGFVITVNGYARFLEYNALSERIRGLIDNIDVDDTAALQRAAAAIRELILKGQMPVDVREAILDGYRDLSASHGPDSIVAVR